jgi:hypothetical protein
VPELTSGLASTIASPAELGIFVWRGGVKSLLGILILAGDALPKHLVKIGAWSGHLGDYMADNDIPPPTEEEKREAAQEDGATEEEIDEMFES